MKERVQKGSKSKIQIPRKVQESEFTVQTYRHEQFLGI
jgi:hypothetical protein